MKKVLAINGSPRKSGNTAVLLQKALDGAKAQGAEVELIHLIDYEKPPTLDGKFLRSSRRLQCHVV